MNGNGNGKLALAIAGLLITVAAGPLAVWNALSNDLTDTKRRVSQVETRQAEDRASAQADRKEIKQDVKQIGSDVQAVLRKLESMEAVSRAERRSR